MLVLILSTVILIPKNLAAASSSPLDSLCKAYISNKDLNQDSALFNKLTSLQKSEDSLFIQGVLLLKESDQNLSQRNLEAALYNLTKAKKAFREYSPTPYYNAFLHQCFGEFNLYRGSVSEAHLSFDSSAYYFTQIDETIGVAKSYLNKVSLFFNYEKEYDSALRYLEIINPLIKTDSTLILKYHIKKGSVLFAQNKIDDGLLDLFEANNLAKKLKDTTHIFMSSQYISDKYLLLKNFDKSISYATEALDIASKYGNERMIMFGLISLGAPLQESEKGDQAASYFLEAYPIATKINDLFAQATISQNLAGIYEMNGDIAIAKDYFKKAISNFQKLNYQPGEAAAQSNLGKVEYKQKNYAEAERLLTASLVIAENINDKVTQLSSLEDLYNGYKEQNKHKLALTTHERLTQLQQEFATNQHTEELSQIEDDYIAKEQIEHLKKNNLVLKLGNEKATLNKRFYIAVAAFFALGLLLAVYFLINSKKNQNRRKLELEEISFKAKQFEEEKIRLIKDVERIVAEGKNKDEIISHLKNKSNQQSNGQLLSELIQSGLNTDKDWSTFMTEFQLTHQSYLANLKSVSTKALTKTDLKMAFLLKLGLSNTEIGQILNITLSGVKKAKQRFKEKLDVPSSEKLSSFIQNIDSKDIVSL